LLRLPELQFLPEKMANNDHVGRVDQPEGIFLTGEHQDLWEVGAGRLQGKLTT